MPLIRTFADRRFRITTASVTGARAWSLDLSEDRPCSKEDSAEGFVPGPVLSSAAVSDGNPGQEPSLLLRPSDTTEVPYAVMRWFLDQVEQEVFRRQQAHDRADRDVWMLDPLVGVGPLRIGMCADEVAAAIGAEAAQFFTVAEGAQRVSESRFMGLTVFYSSDETLVGVAVDALRGPQVTYKGLHLTGRIPSELEADLTACAAAGEFELRYAHEGSVGVPDLGLVVRVQRSGDRVVTRPLLGIRRWAEDPWESVPMTEWQRPL